MLQKIKMKVSKPVTVLANFIKNNLPAAVSLVLTVTAIILTLVCSAPSVTIFDGEKSYTAFGFLSDLDSAMSRVELKNGNYKIINVSNQLFSTKVEISYYFPLTVQVGETANTYNVTAGRLCDILKSVGIKVDEHDTFNIPADTYINSETTVVMNDVEFVTETKNETIPYGTDVIFSSDYDTNTRFDKGGKVGSKTVTYCVKYVNGVAVESSVLNVKVNEYAIDQTTVFGTKAPSFAGSGSTPADEVPCISTLDAPDDLLLDSNGKPINFSSKKTLRATAYTHTGNNCSTGVKPKPGYVAVDPREIPYGTKMYIMSADGKYVYGYAIAADTGGFIYGSRTDMDLFFDTESECVKFGRRNIVVYFLD